MLKKLDPKEIALDIADIVEASETYDQDIWAHQCKTPACLAGHIVFHYGNFRAAVIWEDADSGFITQARAILNISLEDAMELFRGCPQGFTFPTNKQAADTLRHYVATGKVDWTVEGKYSL